MAFSWLRLFGDTAPSVVFTPLKLSRCGHHFCFEIGQDRFVALLPEKLDNPQLLTTTSLLTVLFVEPETCVSESWIKSTLCTILENESPFGSPFARNLLFVGPNASEVKLPQETQDVLRREKIGKISVPHYNSGHALEQGPHLCCNGSIWQVFRLYDDTAGAFVTALFPSQAHWNTGFHTLQLLGADYQTLGIAVPHRCRKNEAYPLRGLRFAVKDVYRLQGLKTSLCNKSYLEMSLPSDFTAPIVRRLLAAGAQIVGMAKLSSMIGREQPTEATDYHAPFNPRGDGYQSPAGSSSGSAVAVATYDWLDFALGTDTTGSGRRPALVNGVYQMRPTHNAVSLDGIVPVFGPWDVPVAFTRDIAMLKPIISTWFEAQDLLPPGVTQKQYTIVYPEDYFPVANRVQMQIIDVFLSDLEKTLNTKVRRDSIASLWERSPPGEAGTQNVQDYLLDTYVNTNFHDYYHYNTNEFRDGYQAQHHRQPYVVPFTAWKWRLGKHVTKEQRDEGMHRLGVYKKWFLNCFLRHETDQALLIMPISNVTVDYRDVTSTPVARPTGFDPLIVSPILGAPDIVIPIGEYGYESRVSGRKEYLPIAVNVIGLPGTDLSLIDTMQHCLVSSGRPTKVQTGARMFGVRDGYA